MNIDKIKEAVQNQENYLLKRRDRIISHNGNYFEDKGFKCEAYRLLGMINILEAAGIDAQDYKWVYNVI